MGRLHAEEPVADLHVTRIRTELERRFASLVNMSDYQDKGGAHHQNKFLSRAVAAFALVATESATDADAAAAIIDGFDDNGVDAIYFNSADSKLVICQSKWMVNGRGSPSQADVQKLLAGVSRLVNLELDRFGSQVGSHKAMVESAMTNPEVTIKIVLTYNGQDPLGAVVARDLDDFVSKNNDPVELFSLEVLDQKRNYQAVLDQQGGAPISLNIGLREWGSVSEPYLAFYGRVSAREVAAWWRAHGRALLAKNIRSFKGSTDVNEGMASTLKASPSDFWYFNNGITLLCSSIKKTPERGNTRDFGHFSCNGVSVVNGAQTVGQVGSSFDRLDEIPEDAQVLVRLISLEVVPAGFDERITRATNTQNRVEGRDFASLDGNQRRLHRELALDRIDYSFRSGDPQPDKKHGCTLTEAATALACAQNDVAVAVLVKNQIGRLFESIHAAPYTDIFNDATQSRELWKAVRIMRVVDDAVATLSSSSHDRARLIAAHGNRFVLHMVFKDSSMVSWRSEARPIEQLEIAAQEAATAAFAKLALHLKTHEPTAYLQPLFKTQDRCRSLMRGLTTAPAPTEPAKTAPVPATPPNATPKNADSNAPQRTFPFLQNE